jgi:ABC-type antimicrobial peptide transport system permease subunit
MGAIITPAMIYEGIIDDSVDSIVAGVVAMAVMLGLMCICMYFIMRSSLLTRVKEIGVYRAIGVSRGNLISRSLVESAVLVSLTVLVGYIATGIFIRVASSMSTLVADAFYYPLPMALTVLAVLIVTSITCGTLPTVALVAKTPSEILAKYDI